MARIQTTFRIEHKTEKEKKEFETKLDEAIKAKLYSSRAEWLRQKAREEIIKRMN